MFSDRIVADGSLRRTADGFAVDIRSNWYRALPLASFALLDVTVDGEAIPAEKLSVQINGRTRTLDEMAPELDEYWYVLDPATVYVADHRLDAGEHTVTVRLGQRAPYILHGPAIEDVLVVVEECTKTLIAA